MCFGGRNKVDEEGAAKSRELDKIIRADEKRMQREVKLLLLGTHSLLCLKSTRSCCRVCYPMVTHEHLTDPSPRQVPASLESRQC